MDVVVSPLYLIGGILDSVIKVGGIIAVIYALYLLRKIAYKN